MTRIVGLGLALMMALVPGLGCGDGDGDGDAPGREGSRGEGSFGPKDQARLDALFAASCIGCHHDEGPAPFPLLTGDQRRRRARQIAEVVDSGYMPPWLPTSAGEPLAGSRRLSAADRQLVALWAESEGAEGGADLEVPADPGREAELGEPDLVLPLTGPVTIPAEGIGIQHTLVFDPALERPRTLRALRYRPSNPKALHGGAFLRDGTGVARRMDAMSPDVGYRSPGGMGLALIGSLDAFSPGAPVRIWPEGRGPQVRVGETISLELHLFPRGRVEKEQGELALWFEPELSSQTRRPVTGIAMGSLLIDIPPDDADYRVRASLKLPVAADFVSCFPMARYVCRSVRLTVTPPGEATRVLLDIADFDLNWVERYQLLEPVALPAGSVFEMEMRYDNSAANPQNPRVPPERVRAGMRAIDEAGFVLIHLSPQDAAGMKTLNDLHVQGFADRLAERRRIFGR